MFPSEHGHFLMHFFDWLSHLASACSELPRCATQPSANAEENGLSSGKTHGKTYFLPEHIGYSIACSLPLILGVWNVLSRYGSKLGYANENWACLVLNQGVIFLAACLHLWCKYDIDISEQKYHYSIRPRNGAGFFPVEIMPQNSGSLSPQQICIWNLGVVFRPRV